jgi:hypothetical protein
MSKAAERRVAAQKERREHPRLPSHPSDWPLSLTRRQRGLDPTDTVESLRVMTEGRSPDMGGAIERRRKLKREQK